MSSQTSEIPLSESRNTRSQLYWNTLVRLPAQVINFAISLLVARILMPRDFGIMGITMMLIGYANLFTNFGFAEAIIQKNIHNKKILDSIFTFNLIFSIFLATLFFGTSGLIANFFRTPECNIAIRVLSIMFIVSSFPIIPNAMLRRDMNFKVIAIIDLIQSILMSFTTLYLALKGFGYWALINGQLIPLIIIAVVLCLKAKYLPFIYYNHSLMKSIYDFGIWNFVKAQLGFISQHIDIFTIGRWLGPVSLGFYDKAMSLGMVPLNSIIMNINSVMFSSFSLIKNDIDLLQNSFKKSLALISVINCPIYLGLIAIAPYFVEIFLGNKWSPMVTPFQIVLFGIIFKANAGLLASLNIGVGEYKSHTIRLFIALIIFIISCLTLFGFGLNGIALSFCIFCITQFFLSIMLTKKAIQINWQDIIRSMSPGLIASTVMFVVTYLISLNILNQYSLVNMVIQIFIGVLVYLLSLILMRSEIVMELIISFKGDVYLGKIGSINSDKVIK